jgi:hypothetical protein
MAAGMHRHQPSRRGMGATIGYVAMKLVLSVIAAALLAVMASLALGEPEGPGWLHLIGLGLSVAALLVIWLWPGIEQPKRPPP